MSDGNNTMSKTRAGQQSAIGQNVKRLVCKRPTSRSASTLLIPISRVGGGHFGLYEGEAGNYFVRAIESDSGENVDVSLDEATKLYELETRFGLARLIARKLKIQIRVEGDDGSIYDTSKDKQLYQESWDYEGVSGHETSDGKLYLRFVDPYETRILTLCTAESKKQAIRKQLFGDLTNEEMIDRLAWSIELWCGSDRTFATLLYKVHDVYDASLEFDAIVVDNDTNLDRVEAFVKTAL